MDPLIETKGELRSWFENNYLNVILLKCAGEEVRNTKEEKEKARGSKSKNSYHHGSR